jgi:hypothetical protein
MKFRILMLAFFVCSITIAQVGIGTTTPETTSLLDISSQNKGFLAPRMTTAQRNAITTPANSLLVYDTDLKSFYYYDTTTTSWLKINSAASERNNFVLVKDVSDLPAPSGGVITLDENTYYEINGTITLTNPIDLNNAYVSGLDADEDVLSFTGGTIFQGSTGGSIRNVTLRGARAFAITGPGPTSSTSLLVQNTVIDGMTTNVGTVSGLGIFFGNIIQFINNVDGIIYSNIGNLLLNNQGWFGTNSGTYETFTGVFGLVEKVSGFSTVNGSAKAINVSSNPTVSNGVILGTVFSGTSTMYVDRYTVGSFPEFNFTNNWTVNCPGIPSESDTEATGYIYFASENATVTNVLTDDVPVKMQGTTTSGTFFRMSDDGGMNNRILYSGSKERTFNISCTATVERSDNGSKNVYSMIIFKNGSQVPSIVSEQTFENGVSKGNFTVLGVLSLDTNDYIEVYMSTDNKNIDPTVTRFNMVID